MGQTFQKYENFCCSRWPRNLLRGSESHLKVTLPVTEPTHQYGRPRSFTRQHCHPEVLFTSSHVLHVNNTAIDTRHMVALVHWRVRENKFLQSQGKVREFQFELAEFTSVIEVRKKCSFKEIGSLSSCPGSVPDSRWWYFPFMMSCHRISTT